MNPSMQIDFEFILWGTVVFLTGFLLSLAVVAVILIQLPSTYFLGRPLRKMWIDRHPVLRLALRVLKNLLGVALIVAGIILSVPGVPGQGILTILIGIMLLDIPGKQRWERKIIGRPRIHQSINRIREKFGKKPLQLHEEQ